MKLEGMSKLQVASITLEDGTSIDVKEIPNVFIFREHKDTEKSEFNMSYKIIDATDSVRLANMCLAMYMSLQTMDAFDIGFEEAMVAYMKFKETHNLKWVKKEGKQCGSVTDVQNAAKES